MPAVKLTSRYIETCSIPEKQPQDHYDTDVRGLVLRVTSTGVRSWSFFYCHKGARRRLTLGQYPGASLAFAREKARDLRGAVQRGEDPWADKKEDEKEAQENGFRACMRSYVEKYAMPNQRRWKETKRLLERFAEPAWGDTPVKEIRRRDIIELLEGIAKDTPVQANQVRSHLSRLFRWLVEREALEVNPIVGVGKLVKVLPRERILNDTEVAALWKATIKFGFPFGPATRLLLLTGMRKSEVSFLRWDELDLAGGWANLPASRMKNGRDFRAPLSASAKALIESMPKTSDLVFTTNGKTPISGWGHAKPRLDELMAAELGQPVTEWHLHDLRRTVASGIARLGFPTEVIKRVLAHVPNASDVTSQVYNWFMYDDQAKAAVQAWAAHIAKVTTGLEVVESVG